MVEVELYLTSRKPIPIDDYGDAHWPPENPNQKFPYYVINNDTDNDEILTYFYRDALNLVGHEIDATLAIAR